MNLRDRPIERLDDAAKCKTVIAIVVSR